MYAGWSPTYYYRALPQHLAALKPEIVLVEVELLNDLSDEALLRWADLDREGLPRKIEGGRYRAAWDGRTVLRGVSFGNPWDRTVLYTLLSEGVGNLLSTLFPNPLFAPTNSATMAAVAAIVADVLMPEKMTGSAAGNRR